MGVFINALFWEQRRGNDSAYTTYSQDRWWEKMCYVVELVLVWLSVVSTLANLRFTCVLCTSRLVDLTINSSGEAGFRTFQLLT